MLSRDFFQQNWNALKPRMRGHWTSLSERDVDAIDGNPDVLLEMLHEKYGIPLAQAQSQIDRFCEENGVAADANPTA
jgi:hypothetical protein